jgi:1-phosphatidylinositol-3-phosphate 5-kinase
MSDTKPLPALPPPTPGTLSEQFQTHRSRFIRYALKETPAASSESSRDVWVDALESALDDLGTLAEQADWLAGIKKRKLAQQSRVKPEGGKRARSSTDSSSTHSSLVAEPSEQQKSAFEQIRELASKPTLPTPHSTPKHLVLCLTPAEDQASVLREDSGFDIVPSNISCTFRAGTYTIHESQDGSSSSILYGLENWNGVCVPALVKLCLIVC